MWQTHEFKHHSWIRPLENRLNTWIQAPEWKEQKADTVFAKGRSHTSRAVVGTSTAECASSGACGSSSDPRERVCACLYPTRWNTMVHTTGTPWSVPTGIPGFRSLPNITSSFHIFLPRFCSWRVYCSCRTWNSEFTPLLSFQPWLAIQILARFPNGKWKHEREIIFHCFSGSGIPDKPNFPAGHAAHVEAPAKRTNLVRCWSYGTGSQCFMQE